MYFTANSARRHCGIIPRVPLIYKWLFEPQILSDRWWLQIPGTGKDRIFTALLCFQAICLLSVLKEVFSYIEMYTNVLVNENEGLKHLWFCNRFNGFNNFINTLLCVFREQCSLVSKVSLWSWWSRGRAAGSQRPGCLKLAAWRPEVGGLAASGPEVGLLEGTSTSKYIPEVELRRLGTAF